MDYKQFLIYLYILPDDLLYLIWNFLPSDKRVWFSKEMYYKNYKIHITKMQINDTLYTSYIRFLVRKNLFIPLSLNINHNKKYKLFMLTNRKYKYKANYFQNFIEFLFFYCIENRSQQCQNLLKEYYSELKKTTQQYRFKNKKIRENKWIN